MCHEPTVTSNTPDDGVLLPFMRSTARPGGRPPKPGRPTKVGALDSLSETRAMVGLASLAAEALPAGHATEFCTILELVYERLGGILEALQRGAGQPPLEPVEA